MRHDITELFCLIDDFCKTYDCAKEKYLLKSGCKQRKPTRVPGLTDAEIITILVLFQRDSFKNFKCFYLRLKQDYADEFQKLPTYDRFLVLQQRVLQKLSALMHCICSKNAKEAYIDSTAIKVCHNKRIRSHKVFKGLGAIGKSTMGWFYGFKLHLLIDLKGNIINACITPGNCDDRAPVEKLVQYFQGVVFGDKGYISKSLFDKLFEKGIKLVTGIKKNMQNNLMILKEKMLLKKRSLIESVFNLMKRKFMLEHSRHRSIVNFGTHILSTLISYQLSSKKPSISNCYCILNP